MNLQEEKNRIRTEIRRAKNRFTVDERNAMSVSVMDRLLSHPRIREAQTVLMYYSLPDEVNTTVAVDRLLQAGKTVLLPVVIDDENLELRRYEKSSDLREGSFHIPEPTGPRFSDYDSIEVVAVPGMGFDRRCNRLGRGKGYYDRLLARLPHAYKIGVCFDFQKVDSLPANAHDMKMDEVL